MGTSDTIAAPDEGATSSAPLLRLRSWQHGVVFLAACLVVLSRRPDMLFHAQFYAEDGMCWFADAYNRGWLHALLLPWHGIFQTAPRLAAGPALLAPLWMAPALLHVFQIAMQAVPVNILLSGCCAGWGDLRFRAGMAVLYLALPDCSEISYGISWAMWPMAVAAALLVAGALPEGWGQRAAEAALLLLAGLSGPMCGLLLPISGYLAWKRPNGWRWVQCSILLGCTALQMLALRVLDPHGRPYYGLRVGVGNLIRIFSGNVLWGALLGRTSLASLGGRGEMIFLAVSAAGGLGLLVWCWLHARLEIRLFLIFAAMLLGASLARPTEYPPAGMTIWEYLAQLPDMRYWFVPSLAFAWAILWCWRNGNRGWRAACTLLLGVMAVGVVRNWEHPPLPDLHFAEYVARFEAAAPGTVVKIPENPLHSGWEIALVKH